VPTFLSVFNLADGGATKTATAKSTGAADANKMVMAAIIGNGTAVPTSVTFTPDTGSPVVVTTASLSRPASGPDVMFYQALMPTGTTTDISVLFPSNPFTNYEMAIWSVDSSLLNSTTAASASAVRASTGGGPAISTNLNVQVGGFILAVAFMNAFSSFPQRDLTSRNIVVISSTRISPPIIRSILALRPALRMGRLPYSLWGKPLERASLLKSRRLSLVFRSR